MRVFRFLKDNRGSVCLTPVWLLIIGIAVFIIVSQINNWLSPVIQMLQAHRLLCLLQTHLIDICLLAVLFIKPI